MVFSGIVEGTGKITTVSKLENLTKISIETPQKFSDGIKIGASVCVDGVCLTVSSINGDVLNFDIIMETLNVTTFKNVKKKDIVNLERSMRLGFLVLVMNVIYLIIYSPNKSIVILLK